MLAELCISAVVTQQITLANTLLLHCRKRLQVLQLMRSWPVTLKWQSKSTKKYLRATSFLDLVYYASFICSVHWDMPSLPLKCDTADLSSLTCLEHLPLLTSATMGYVNSHC